MYIYDHDKDVVHNNLHNRDNAHTEYESYVSPARINHDHLM